ncbi:rhodanese-like domain-containing protein [Flavobacterium sp.]|uniref:rhodanese-like domain-containing protein n=1 Tax=Flavobacterium sp. TaxID=239 RepID=UPI00375311F1
MKKIISIIVLTLILYSCQGQTSKNNEVNEVKESYKTIDGLLFEEKILSEKNAQLIDVRSPEEYNVEHIQNAKNINWNSEDFVSNVEKLDKSKPVLVYCKVGGRSSQAATKLSELGFKEVYNLDGGIMKWKGKKTFPSDSKPTGMNSLEFDKLIHSDKKVIINFSAKWCEPCKKMKPYLMKMKEELKAQTSLIMLDADENKTLLESMKITGLPVVLIYENGVETWSHIGFLSENDLRKHL